MLPSESRTDSPVVLRPGCKVNLYLEIVGHERNGYHELDTLFYPLASPCDELSITPRNIPGLDIQCTFSSLQGRNNILHQAYTAFAETTGFAPGLEVHLDKHIPMGGGLGGGSSDAAAFLGYLNGLLGEHGLSEPDLAELGLGLGADIPFFFRNRPCWAGGRGEKLQDADVGLDCYHTLLICPEVHVSTAWAYGAWDDYVSVRQIKKITPRILTRQTRADRNPSSRGHVICYNDFESVVFPVYPILYDVKLAMISYGAGACVMSGSGASLFALFKRECDREKACSYLDASAIPYFI